ncbi:MAG: hypothetical protein QOE97_3525 [Pseudonocardiales bacterium]|nr:hypothetical protein [Pseudonocardiales bacterium]
MTGAFAGRVAVVTGAASGIGAAIAVEFAREGARVALLDIDEPGLSDVRTCISGLTEQPTMAAALDIADDDSRTTVLDRIVRQLGPIDHLANGAATFIAAGLEAAPSHWQRALDVNVKGTAMMTSQAATRMRDGGSVVNVSSISAHTAQPARWTYNATKAAIVALTRCQALDLSPRGIRVNCVSPGWIWTPEVARAAQGDRQAHEPVWGRYHMLRRLGEPEEVARAALFLCSSQASFITATELFVDGGYHALGPEGLGETSHFAGTE